MRGPVSTFRPSSSRHLADFAGPCLLVTHDPLDALVLADRLLVLEDGRIVQEGTPAAVARRPATEYVAKLVGLNLYAGDVDGAKVRLRGGGSFVVPDHDQHGEVLVALRPSAVVVSVDQPDSPARVTAGRRRSSASPCSPTGSGSTSRASRPPWWTSRLSAVSELELTSGSRVWLTAKATDLEVYGADVPGYWKSVPRPIGNLVRTRATERRLRCQLSTVRNDVGGLDDGSHGAALGDTELVYGSIVTEVTDVAEHRS